jgi:serine/threonine protein kinase
MSSRGTISADARPYEGLVLEGRIELIREIGVGAQGVVWLVREIGMPRRECAAKLFFFLSEERNSYLAEKIRVDFESEISKLARLEGAQNVINLHYIIESEVEIEEKNFYFIAIVMEYSEIGDLGRFLRSKDYRNMRVADRIDLMHGLAKGLRAAHDYQIYHSDLKPSNVLLFKEGRSVFPKLADFGVAIAPGDFSGPRGTPAYMAPEVLEGAVANSMSDIFGLGLLLHEVATGQHPFDLPTTGDAPSEIALYRLHYRANAYTSKGIGREYGDLARLLTRMLANDPGTRPSAASVTTVLSGLGALIHTTAPIDEGPLARDRFVWNPIVHEMLGCRRSIAFLHSTHPEADVRWLQVKMREVGITSYSLCRVLGAYDFVISVWADNEAEAKLDEIMRNYESEHRSNRHLRLTQERCEHHSVVAGKVDFGSEDDLVRSLSDIVSGKSVAEQYEALKSKGFVFMQKDEQLQSVFGVPGFLLIEANRDLDENEVEYYLTNIQQYVRQFPKSEGVAVENVIKLSGVRTFLIEFALAKIELYGEFLFGLASFVDRKIFAQMRTDFSYKSLISLDRTVYNFGDDGMIGKLIAREAVFAGKDK